jgi:PAS domain S-box-containing protein
MGLLPVDKLNEKFILRKLCEVHGDSYFLISEEGAYLDFITEDQDLIGKFENIIHKTIHTLLPHKVAQTHLKLIKKVIESGTNQKINYTISVRGEKKYYDITYTPYSQKTVLAIVREISKLKKQELQIDLERKNLRNILNSMEDGVYIINRNYEITFINPIVEKEFGILQNTKCYEYFLEKIEPCEDCKLEQILKGNRLKKIHHNYKKGKIYQIISNPIRDSKGDISKLSLLRDITESTLMKKRLRKEKEKYRSLVENAHEGIWRIDHRNKTTFVNKRMAEMLGYNVEEMIGRHLFSFMDDEQVKICKNNLARQRQGIKEPHEFEFRHKTRKKIFTRIEASPILDKEGNYIGSLACVADVTKRKQAELEMKRLHKLRAEFINRISHELKTPLVAIKGYTQMLMKDFNSEFDEKACECLNEIVRGSNRLEKLINKILETSKVKSEKLKLNKQRVSISEVIDDSIEQLEGLINLRNHSLSINVDKNLTFKFDQDKILDVFKNLISNSIKFTPPQGKIEIKSQKGEGKLIISIKDNGIGLTVEEKKRLFSEFGKIEHYGEGLNIITEGSGLGLFISRKIVQRHGGRIWVESEGRNHGSIFYFTLPLSK